MLVFSRRKGQRIVVRDNAGNLLAELVVTELHRSSVKLGIQAPEELTVLRGEIDDPGSAE